MLCPGISKSLDPVAGQLSNTIAAKLTAVEGSLKESITKLVKSKVRRTRLWHSWGRRVVTSLGSGSLNLFPSPVSPGGPEVRLAASGQSSFLLSSAELLRQRLALGWPLVWACHRVLQHVLTPLVHRRPLFTFGLSSVCAP